MTSVSPTPKDTEAETVERVWRVLHNEHFNDGNGGPCSCGFKGEASYHIARCAVAAALAASPAVTEGERAPEEWKPRAGYMHPVDESFYRLAIKERDYERLRANRLAEEVALLKAALPASPAVPAAEDETECPACRAGIAPWECGRPAPAVPAVPAEEPTP